MEGSRAPKELAESTELYIRMLDNTMCERYQSTANKIVSVLQRLPGKCSYEEIVDRLQASLPHCFYVPQVV